MSQKVEFVLDAKDAGLVRAWLNAQQSVMAYEKGLQAVDKGQQRAARSGADQSKALAEVNRLLKSAESPAEAYQRRLDAVAKSLQAGTIAEHEANRARRAAKGILDQATGSQSRFTTSITSGIMSGVASYATLTNGIGLAKQALEALLATNEEFIKRGQEAGKIFDKSSRAFAIAANLSPEEQKAADERSVQIGIETGFSREKVGAAANALASAGFSAQEATGGTLRALLQTMNAQGLRDEDPGRIAEALAKYLSSQDLEMTEANVRKVGNQFQAFGPDTSLRFRDLPFLANIGAGLEGKVSQEQQIASQAILSRTKDAGQAATETQAIVQNLSTARGQKDRSAALDELGLKPEQVDFIGEDLTDVVKTLDKALSAKPEKDRGRLLRTLVEGANIATFETLAKSADEIEQRAKTAEAEGAKLFPAAEKIGSESRDAIETRLKLQQDAALAKRDDRSDLLRSAIETQSINQGEAPGITAGRSAAFDRSRSIFGLFDSGEGATSAAAGVSGIVGRTPEALGRILDGDVSGAITGLFTGAAGDVFGAARGAQTGFIAQPAALETPAVSTAVPALPGNADQPGVMTPQRMAGPKMAPTPLVSPTAPPPPDPLMQRQTQLLERMVAQNDEMLRRDPVPARPINLPPKKPDAVLRSTADGRGTR